MKVTKPMTDEAEPTALERLVGLLCELPMDVIPYADPQRDAGRAQRWRETLVTVTAAIDERIEHALQRRRGKE